MLLIMSSMINKNVIPIIDKGGMELVNCICDCVHNVLEGNIPVNDKEEKILERHKDCLRTLVNKKTSDQKRKHLYTGRRIPRISHPYTSRISRKTVHRTIMDEIKKLLMTELRSFSMD